MMKFFKNRRGFTLTELMVVVVILGILVAIAIPIYNNLDEKAKASAEEANIRTIKSVVLQYCMENSVTQDNIVITPTFAADGKSVETLSIKVGSGDATTLDLSDYIDEWPMSPYGDNLSYQYGTGGIVEQYAKPAG